MKTSIRIGLTYTGTDEKHSNYLNWLQGADPEIEIVKLTAGETDLANIEGLDGIVMSGGIDVHPGYYNSDEIDYPNAPTSFNKERDAFEKEIYEMSQQQRIPLLGICRGMQFVNCLRGGTLINDVGDKANAIHRFDEADKLHPVNIEPRSLLNDITGTILTNANSAHHQAINVLGEGLKINARSADGIVEGIEWENKLDKAFFLGIQWHPERMYKHGLGDTPASKNIRDSFINEIKNSRNI